MTLEEIKNKPENKGSRSDGSTYEMDWRWSGVFSGKCDGCGKEFNIRTQEDNHPEYYTGIYVEHCPGQYTKFELPVN